MTLRGRLTLTMIVVLAPIVLGLALAFDLALAHVLRQQLDEGLAARARDLAALLRHDDDGGVALTLDDRVLPEYAEDHGAYFQIRSAADGSSLVRSRSLGDDDLPSGPGALHRPQFADVTLPDGRAGRLVTASYTPRGPAGGAPGDPVVLAVARSTEELALTLVRLRAWLWSLAALALLGAWVAALLGVRSGLRPLRRTAEEVDRIDGSALERRLDLDGIPAELHAPIRRFNALLDRLQASFERERRFNANVGHELRTPLSALRSVLEVAASRVREPEAYRLAVDQAVAVLDRLVVVVRNLLLLSRADAGQLVARPRRVALRELLERAWREHAAIAQERRLEFELEVPDDVQVDTDPELLEIVVRNLLENAASYTQTGGTIRVRCRPGCLLEVWDSGPVPAAAELERMFDPLWRADEARTGGGEHVGIGLSLSRSVARALDLRLNAAVVDGGLALRLRAAREADVATRVAP